MGKLNNNAISTPNGYSVTGAIPIDDRTRVTSVLDLTATNTFGLAEYNGLITYVSGTKELYVLTADTLKTGNDSNWVKIVTEKDLQQQMQTLAGVFQFKGVAYSIDEDHTTITVKSGTKTASGSDITGYECTGFYYNMSHQPFYEWKKDSDIIYVNGANGTGVYTKSQSESTVWYVVYNSTVYYAKDVASNKVTSFQSLDGGIIYPAGDGINSATATNFYSDGTTKDETTLLGLLTPQSYSAYTFAPVANTSFSGTAVIPGIEAATTNGHVYQIGEKEYASNGFIWVELGSPKDEITWLVINS